MFDKILSFILGISISMLLYFSVNQRTAIFLKSRYLDDFTKTRYKKNDKCYNIKTVTKKCNSF